MMSTEANLSDMSFSKHKPSCDLHSPRGQPEPSYFGDMFSSALYPKPSGSICFENMPFSSFVTSPNYKTKMAGHHQNPFKIFEGNKSCNFLFPTENCFALNFYTPLHPTEFNVMTDECYEEIGRCSPCSGNRSMSFAHESNEVFIDPLPETQSTNLAVSSDGHKVDHDYIYDIGNHEEKPMEAVTQDDNNVTANHSGFQSEDSQFCSVETNEYYTDSEYNAGHLSETSEIKHVLVDNTAVTETSDLNNNCDTVSFYSCNFSSETETAFDTWSDSETCDDDESSCSSVCSEDADSHYVDSDDSSSGLSATDDDEFCVWDRIINVRTPYTTLRRADSGYRTYSKAGYEDEYNEDVENEPKSLNHSTHGSEDDDSFPKQADDDQFFQFVRPSCLNPCISSIIGWDDDGSSDEESDDSTSSCCDDDSFDDFFDSHIPNYAHAVKDRNDTDSPQQNKAKVRFSEDVEVHHMIAWSFAYKQARKGEWERMARDRERFRNRIANIASHISWIFTSAHRNKMYQILKNPDSTPL